MEVDSTSTRIVIRDLEIDLIDANAWNPNEMDELTFNRLVAEIESVGFVEPIQVVPMSTGRYRILGGYHRCTAAKVLGWEKIPCIVLTEARWQDEDLQKFVTTRLNVLRGKMNPDKFLNMYQEMSGKYGEESLQDLFAYTDADAWGKLLKDIGKGLKKSLPPELAAKFDEVKDEIKSLDGLSSTLNSLFAKYGNTLQYNFMVFTYGGKDHVYVQMDKSTKKSVDTIMQHCQDNGADINDVIGSSLRTAAEQIRE